MRLPEGRETFARYFANAVDIAGEEVCALLGLSQRVNANLVVGVIERDGSTLYCTALFIDPGLGLAATHRKADANGN